MKKTIFLVILALASGAFLGKFTFDKYENLNVENTIKVDNNVYALLIGAYDNKEDMKDSITNIDRYIYLSLNGEIKAYVAISSTKSNIQKIKKIYDDKNINLKIEKINISNDEFIQNLNEYEKLLSVAEDEKSLLIIENQILSCYEELVIKDE